jgi:hypothetical protein
MGPTKVIEEASSHVPELALLVSVVALFISALSLWLTWRRDRRIQQANYPLVELHVASSPIEPGIHSVLLVVTNRMEQHIYLKNFRVLRPMGAAFVEHREVSEIEPPTIFRNQRDRIGVQRVCLTGRGTAGAHWGHTRYLDVGSSRKRAITVRFKVDFDLVETPQRLICFPIKRTIDCSPRTLD